MSKIQLKVDELNAMSPAKIVENEKVEAKFIQMYNAIHGRDKGLQAYTKEKFNFQKVLQENPALMECSKLSLFGSFLDIAVNGLSLDPTGRPHCYLIPRTVKSGYKDDRGKDIYEKRASVAVTGYGELVMRMRAGQIKYADNPVIAYEGDTFRAELVSGRKVVTYAAAIPRKSTKIIGAFIRIVRADGSEDFQWLLEGDIDRLKSFSSKANSYWKDGKRVGGEANALYSSNAGQIDPGFLENKMIKHAFDAYPKVQIGKFTMLETQEEPVSIDYGLDGGIEDSAPEQSAGFGADAPQSAPEEQNAVVVQTSNDDEEAGF